MASVHPKLASLKLSKISSINVNKENKIAMNSTNCAKLQPKFLCTKLENINTMDAFLSNCTYYIEIKGSITENYIDKLMKRLIKYC